VPALRQAFVRLVALKRLGVLLFVLAATLCASSTASALEPARTKTRVWGFDFAEHNSDGLLSAATSGKHQGNRLALSEVASGSLLAAEGGAVAGRITGFTKHGLNQAISRDGVGVSAKAILDAVKNPRVVADQGKGVVKYVGEHATVILNDTGKVITTWAHDVSAWRIAP